LSLIGALLLVPGVAGAQEQATTASPASAQAAAPLPTSPKLGQFDFGFRGDSFSGDEARYNRFRDLRDGAFLDRFRIEKETETWFARGEANNVGYRDQRYAAAFESIGKLKVDFEWNQIPLFISKDSRSLYSHTGNGVLVIDDAIQQSIQSATALGNAARDLAITNAVSGARPFELRSRRDIGRFDLVYTLNRDVDFKFNLKNSTRSGFNMMSFLFGTSPGGFPSLEMGVPLDDRTTDVKGAFEFANRKGLLSLGYNGSWYDNSIPLVRFDNPLRFNDISGGASVGQAVMWPTNSAFSVNVTGSYKLAPRTRANAYVSIGRSNQNEPLAPATVNTALVAPSIERLTADASADIVTTNFNVNSRPVDNVWLNARYRYYDYANKTPHFETTALIGDWSVGTAHLENEPFSVKRHTLDLDASFTPVDYLSVGAGYGRENATRTFRVFEDTSEDVFRFTVDSLGNQYVTVRLKYEFSSRDGSGLNTHVLDEASEHPETRHYDVANRDRSRVTTLLTVTPIDWLSFNAAFGDGNDDYNEVGFGLRDNDNRTYSVGFDVQPLETVGFGFNYGYEKYTANQHSRTALPAGNASGPEEFLDPRRDWTLDQDDTVKTASANLDLLKALPRTDIRFAFDVSDGKATYVYGIRPDAPTVSIPRVESAIAQPVQLAPVKNRLTGGRFDLQYFVRPNVAFGGSYWYEAYKVQDFALGPTTLDQLAPRSASSGLIANTIYSGYLYRPYTAHTGWLRVTYLW
jgi:MtrB/PioB family decaheme-associated outer membrane protein